MFEHVPRAGSGVQPGGPRLRGAEQAADGLAGRQRAPAVPTEPVVRPVSLVNSTSATGTRNVWPRCGETSVGCTTSVAGERPGAEREAAEVNGAVAELVAVNKRLCAP